MQFLIIALRREVILFYLKPFGFVAKLSRAYFDGLKLSRVTSVATFVNIIVHGFITFASGRRLLTINIHDILFVALSYGEYVHGKCSITCRNYIYN